MRRSGRSHRANRLWSTAGMKWWAVVRWATSMKPNMQSPLLHETMRQLPRRARQALAAIGALALASCSVGQGTGFAEGRIRLDDCRVDVSDYSLQPTFFGADYIESPGDVDGETRMVNLRVQRGSYREGESDGLYVFLRDVNLIGRERIGVPIDLAQVDGEDPLVRFTLYANETCTSGLPVNFWQVPGVLQAVSGTITFDAVRAEGVEGSGDAFIARFENVRFASPNDPERRNAELRGAFSFFYQRGAPAQRFP